MNPWPTSSSPRAGSTSAGIYTGNTAPSVATSQDTAAYHQERIHVSKRDFDLTFYPEQDQKGDAGERIGEHGFDDQRDDRKVRRGIFAPEVLLHEFTIPQ